MNRIHQFIFIFFLSTFTVSLYGQNAPPRETINIKAVKSYIRIWGFLKYFSPAKTTHNWDSVFLAQMPTYYGVQSDGDLNKSIAFFLNNEGNVEGYPAHPIEYDTSLVNNRDFQELVTFSALSPEINAKVQEILLHRQTGENYFVKSAIDNGVANYTHESFGSKELFPSLEYRLLALARYWNIVAYFYPYRYLSDRKPWSGALDDLIPLFMEARDSVDYYYCLRQMAAAINDYHAELTQMDRFQPFGRYRATFQTQRIQNKLIVTDITLPTEGLQVGDEIVKIDGVPVSELVEQQRKYISAPNESVFNYWVGYSLVNGNDSTSLLTLSNGKELETVRYRSMDRYVALIKAHRSKHKGEVKPSASYYLIEDGAVGYVDLGRIKSQEVEHALDLFKHTQGIVFDIRDVRYPQMYIWKEFAKYLSDDRRPFNNYYIPNYDLYGTFRLKNTGYVGKRGKLKYKGRIAVLVNAGTQSRMEFCVMAFQTFPKVKVVGSQTAGTDGDVSNEINLPGGYKTRITGAGVTYLDGGQTQRIGIVPDIPVHLTVEDIKAGKDMYLKAAIKYIEGAE